jgi:biotin operon repressor
MHFQHTLSILDRRGLSAYERLVFTALCIRADKDKGTSYSSLERIASDLEISKRAVVNALAGLKQKGHIQVLVKGGGKGNATVYRVLPAPKSAQQTVNEMHCLPDGETETVHLTTPNGAFHDAQTVHLTTPNGAPDAPQVSIEESRREESNISAAAKGGMPLNDANNEGTKDARAREARPSDEAQNSDWTTPLSPPLSGEDLEAWIDEEVGLAVGYVERHHSKGGRLWARKLTSRFLPDAIVEQFPDVLRETKQALQAQNVPLSLKSLRAALDKRLRLT